MVGVLKPPSYRYQTTFQIRAIFFTMQNSFASKESHRIFPLFGKEAQAVCSRNKIRNWPSSHRG